MSVKLARSWYALYTRSKSENMVCEALGRKAVEAFLPKIRVRSKNRRRDRKKMLDVPLFSGYLFVKTDLRADEHLKILKTPGAIRLIGSSDGPFPVPSESVESLRIMVAANKKIITGTSFKKGTRVMVTNGPFSGITGIFARYGGEGRVVVHIGVMGQFAAVEVNEADISLLPDETSAPVREKFPMP